MNDLTAIPAKAIFLISEVSFSLAKLLLMMRLDQVKVGIVLEQLCDSRHSCYFRNLTLFLSFVYAWICYSKSPTIYKNDEMKFKNHDS